MTFCGMLMRRRVWLSKWCLQFHSWHLLPGDCLPGCFLSHLFLASGLSLGKSLLNGFFWNVEAHQGVGDESVLYMPSSPFRLHVSGYGAWNAYCFLFCITPPRHPGSLNISLDEDGPVKFPFHHLCCAPYLCCMT